MPESDSKASGVLTKVFGWLRRKNASESLELPLKSITESEVRTVTERNFFESLYEACQSAGYIGSDVRFTQDLRALFVRFTPPGRRGDKGDPGMAGPQGSRGPGGKDGFDKFAVNSREETMMAFSWKGVRFEAPIPNEHLEGFPHGPLKQEDIDFIEVVYGTKIVSRMAIFWRREYDYIEDVSLFKGEKSAPRKRNSTVSAD